MKAWVGMEWNAEPERLERTWEAASSQVIGNSAYWMVIPTLGWQWGKFSRGHPQGMRYQALKGGGGVWLMQFWDMI